MSTYQKICKKVYENSIYIPIHNWILVTFRFQLILKYEYMKSSHCQKYEQKN